jgi:hypothetical protein
MKYPTLTPILTLAVILFSGSAVGQEGRAKETKKVTDPETVAPRSAATSLSKRWRCAPSHA